MSCQQAQDHQKQGGCQAPREAHTSILDLWPQDIEMANVYFNRPICGAYSSPQILRQALQWENCSWGLQS